MTEKGDDEEAERGRGGRERRALSQRVTGLSDVMATCLSQFRTEMACGSFKNFQP